MDKTAKEIVAAQVLAPADEARRADGIDSLTPIRGAVSRAVRAQYEENPYPRWRSLSLRQPCSYTDHILREIAPNAPALAPATGTPRILVAGCGTGKQAISLARIFATSSVLAVDLSCASLGYAMRMAEKYGVANVEFRQADILELGALDERFDVIACSGVLHHLADPAAGLDALFARLRPGGFLKLGLYSALARRHVTRFREIASERGFEPTLEGVRALRRFVRESTCQDSAMIETFGDFYSTSEVRDLLLHEMEHVFTLPELADLLAPRRLEFLGFVLADPTVRAAYAAAHPADPGAVDLGCWDRFERANPDTFNGMYQFWCRAAG